MSKMYGDEVRISASAWCKDILWEVLELQMEQYNETRNELSEKGTKLGEHYWQILPPPRGLDVLPRDRVYLIKWFASDEDEDN